MVSKLTIGVGIALGIGAVVYAYVKGREKGDKFGVDDDEDNDEEHTVLEKDGYKITRSNSDSEGSVTRLYHKDNFIALGDYDRGMSTFFIDIGDRTNFHLPIEIINYAKKNKITKCENKQYYAVGEPTDLSYTQNHRKGDIVTDVAGNKWEILGYATKFGSRYYKAKSVASGHTRRMTDRDIVDGDHNFSAVMNLPLNSDEEVSILADALSHQLDYYG